MQGGARNRKNKNENIIKNNKGFTLVELIVVLVILAILAVLLIPALSGYIDKAKKEQYVSYARYALMATQSVLSEMYAAGAPAYDIGGYCEYCNLYGDKYLKKVQELIDDTDLYDAALVISPAYKGGEWGTTTDKSAYTIKAAAYIYQVEEGGSYKMLLYDGKTWTEVDREYSDYNKARTGAISKVKGIVGKKGSCVVTIEIQ